MDQGRPRGLVPHIVVSGAVQAIEFYKEAFGAQEVHRVPAEDGKRLMHAELKIGEGTLYLCDDFPEFCGGKSRSATALGGSPVVIHQYVPNVDDAVKRAADAGAKVVMPPADMFWGDRYASIEDPFGHSWSLATPLPQR